MHSLDTTIRYYKQGESEASHPLVPIIITLHVCARGKVITSVVVVVVVVVIHTKIARSGDLGIIVSYNGAKNVENLLLGA